MDLQQNATRVLWKPTSGLVIVASLRFPIVPTSDGNSQRGGNDALSQKLVKELTKLSQGEQPSQIQSWIDDEFKREGDYRRAMGAIVHQSCRNCILAGRGCHNHDLRQCRSMKNLCAIPCSRCVAAGRVKDNIRGTDHCTR